MLHHSAPKLHLSSFLRQIASFLPHQAGFGADISGSFKLFNYEGATYAAPPRAVHRAVTCVLLCGVGSGKNKAQSVSIGSICCGFVVQEIKPMEFEP